MTTPLLIIKRLDKPNLQCLVKTPEQQLDGLQIDSRRCSGMSQKTAGESQ